MKCVNHDENLDEKEERDKVDKAYSFNLFLTEQISADAKSTADTIRRDLREGRPEIVEERIEMAMREAIGAFVLAVVDAGVDFYSLVETARLPENFVITSGRE
jgi:hypothetical protein